MHRAERTRPARWWSGRDTGCLPTAPRAWDDSDSAALQAYAGLVASLLVAAVTARVTGRLAAELQAAVEHRSLLERAIAVLVHREGMDEQAALEWLRTAARSSGREVAQMADHVLGGAPPPTLRLRRTAGTRSCTRARPDSTSGEASLAGPRPSAYRQPLRAAGSSTPKPSGVAPTKTVGSPPQQHGPTTGRVQPLSSASRLVARKWAAAPGRVAGPPATIGRQRAHASSVNERHRNRCLGQLRRWCSLDFYAVEVMGWNEAITATASTSMSRSSRTSRRTSTAVLAGGCWVLTYWSRTSRTTGSWVASTR